MKNVLVLKQEKPYEQIYHIAGPTHLGRSSSLEWRIADREMPDEFKDLEVLIHIVGTDTVSRNHAGILPSEDGSFYLIDLNSSNGTFLNNKRVHGRERLNVGDMVSIASTLDLIVMGIIPSDQNHHALFVGHEGGNLQGVRQDLYQLGKRLEERGFAGNIKELFNEDANRKNVLEYLEQVAHLTTPESHFIFYYSGHGNHDGVQLGIDKISPNDLYSRLRNIRGKKAIILDNCRAGVFINYENKEKMPPNTLVLAGSSETKPAYEGPDFTIAGGEYMGKFTAALIKYLDENRGRLNLKDFKEKLNQNLSGSLISIYHKQEADVVGIDYTMLTAHSRV